ncbi:hypothetical protein N1030_10425 [Desulfovibrio mangrovi]|uniref:class I SAM-dependent methyltransferase n=1 Tax=Desulfovibrio mangrovi TaxID=2976983 RepID=UPI0022476C98|nr:hypothetical protein [Desulfovibrio mangrovi]UZP66037.1 hypothetical protein N1030_10425 [Desulfovibrio mangrovi]
MVNAMLMKTNNQFIDIEEVNWLTLTSVSSIDVVGKVFSYRGKVFRAINEEMTDYVHELFDKNIVRKLVERGLLIDTRRTELQLKDYPLILWHEKIPHITKPAFWPWEFYRKAGMKFIELNEVLMNWGLATCDGHQENIMMHNNCSPVFIDFGSILPLNMSNNGLTSLKQFKGCFFNMMLLRAQKPELENILRYICYHKGSILDNEYQAITGDLIEAPYHDREMCLRFYKALLPKLRFENTKTVWTGYHKENDFDFEKLQESEDTRAYTVLRLLKAKQPKTLVDIAANAGKFSLMAAWLGAKVYAFDIHGAAIEKLYSRVAGEESSLDVSVGVHGIYRGDRYNFWQLPLAAKGEVALSLAISHHLSITQKKPMNFIAQTLAAYCDKTLISEFMPYGLGNTKYYPDPFPEDYSLSNYLTAFDSLFERVKVIFYPTRKHWSFRIMLVFEGKLTSGDSAREIEKSYFVCHTDKLDHDDYILRVLCPECNSIFHVEDKSHISCPMCNGNTAYNQDEELLFSSM